MYKRICYCDGGRSLFGVEYVPPALGLVSIEHEPRTQTLDSLPSEGPHEVRVDSLVSNSQRASHRTRGDSASFARKAEGLYILFRLKQESIAGPMH